ncbi:hypothetical protein IJ596_04320 [bacterium]|nr:hypothetical protein [bacterium]
MKIDNLQFNYRPAFGADIVRTKYLNSGIEYANSNAVDVKKKSDFFTALKIIKEDKNHDTFEITGVPGSKIRSGQARRWQVLLDGKRVYQDTGALFCDITDENQSIENTIRFVKKFYGDDKFKEVPELESIGEYKIYKSLLKEAEEKAHSDLNREIDTLFSSQK